jgi:hypothetical protein
MMMLRSASAKAAPDDVFSGIVVDQITHKPISEADILVAQDQALPEVIHSDDHGVFAVRLHPGVTMLKINVSASGYVPELRTSSPTRTGPEEFQLKPSSNVGTTGHTQGPKIHRNIPVTATISQQPSTSTQTVINEGNQGPSIGINNGTANFYLGNPPPPVRNVNPEKVTDAIATLRVAAKGTKLRIDGVGQSADLESFCGQIQQLFQLGGWETFKGSRILNYSSTVISGSGVTTSQGEGVRCFSQNPNVAFIAKRALEQIGYPCQGDYTPDYAQRFPADFYVSIGAPTN